MKDLSRKTALASDQLVKEQVLQEGLNSMKTNGHANREKYQKCIANQIFWLRILQVHKIHETKSIPKI